MPMALCDELAVAVAVLVVLVSAVLKLGPTAEKRGWPASCRTGVALVMKAKHRSPETIWVD